MSLPPFPQKLKGSIFTEVIPQFVKEVNPKRLVELGAIVIEKKRRQMYEPLTNSLKKIQWVKLVSLKAIAIEEKIEDVMTPEYLVMDPLGQTAHSLCVTDCLIHTKSALDSMAVFLTNLLELKARGGERDFKHTKFRWSIAKKDPKLGDQIKKYNSWFMELREIRDEWIHRSSIRSLIIQGKSDVGIMPIPKKVTLNLDEQMKLKISKEDFISTKNFVEHHYSNLINLFNTIIEYAYYFEKRDLVGTIPIPAEAEQNLQLFPTKTTKDMSPLGIKANIRKNMFDW